MQSSQSMYNLASATSANSSPHFVPSHFKQSGYGSQYNGGGGAGSRLGGGFGASYTPNSPLARDVYTAPATDAGQQQQLPQQPSMRRSSTTSRFGGASFGTPRREAHHHHPSLHRHTSRGSGSGGGGTTHTNGNAPEPPPNDDAPPMSSIYDLANPAAGSVNSQRPQTSMQPPKQHLGGRSLTHSQSVASGLNSRYDRDRYTPAPDRGVAVVVFGFPDRLASTVVAHFGRFGRILEYADSSNTLNSDLQDDSPTAHRRSVGHNWIKLTYVDASAARRAVQANGTLIGDRYMVGCVLADQDGADGHQLTSYDMSEQVRGSPTSDSNYHSTANDDAMDIDPKTPPRTGLSFQQTPPQGDDRTGGTFKTPASRFTSTAGGATPQHQHPGTANGGGGGRKIEILASDGIYRHPVSPTDRSAGGRAGASAGGLVASASSRFLSGWLSGGIDTSQTPAVVAANDEPKVQGTPVKESERPNTAASTRPSLAGRLVRGLVDTIFGF